MKCFHYEGHVPQLVLYGPSAPIASKLTADNWQECAILRAKQYLYVASGRWLGTGDDSLRYRVNTSPNDGLSKDFASRDRALAYANALGSGEGQYPAERSSVTYMTLRRGPSRDAITREAPINGGLKQ